MEFVAIWIPVDLSRGLSPCCDPLTSVPLCDHKRDWYLIGLWLTCCVTVFSSVLRVLYAECVNHQQQPSRFFWIFDNQYAESVNQQQPSRIFRDGN